MGYLIAEHFAKVHGGFEAIKYFQDLLNLKIEVTVKGKRVKRHLTIIEISERLSAHTGHLSPAQVCRLRSALFEPVWVNKYGTEKYVRGQAEHLRGLAKEREDFIEEQRKFQFILGKRNEPDIA